MPTPRTVAVVECSLFSVCVMRKLWTSSFWSQYLSGSQIFISFILFFHGKVLIRIVRPSQNYKSFCRLWNFQNLSIYRKRFSVCLFFQKLVSLSNLCRNWVVNMWCVDCHDVHMTDSHTKLGWVITRLVVYHPYLSSWKSGPYNLLMI